MKSALSRSSISTQHAPLILSHDSGPSNSRKRIQNSAIIPGALVIDPFMRKAAQSTGMVVSEHAIWLVTIAMKEHTTQVLRNLVTSSKLLTQGQIPPISMSRMLSSKKKGQEMKQAFDMRDALYRLKNATYSSRAIAYIYAF